MKFIEKDIIFFFGNFTVEIVYSIAKLYILLVIPVTVYNSIHENYRKTKKNQTFRKTVNSRRRLVCALFVFAYPQKN